VNVETDVVFATLTAERQRSALRHGFHSILLHVTQGTPKGRFMQWHLPDLGGTLQSEGDPMRQQPFAHL
jgi:hypothetical protein